VLLGACRMGREREIKERKSFTVTSRAARIARDQWWPGPLQVALPSSSLAHSVSEDKMILDWGLTWWWRSLKAGRGGGGGQGRCGRHEAVAGAPPSCRQQITTGGGGGAVSS
jgi:hypothetical protein